MPLLCRLRTLLLACLVKITKSGTAVLHGAKRRSRRDGPGPGASSVGLRPGRQRAAELADLGGGEALHKAPP